MASRINAIEGPTPTTAETAYLTNPITATQISSAAYNFSLIKDALAVTESKIAQTVGQTSNHPWREFLRQSDLTGANPTGISSGGLIYFRNVTPATNVIGIGAVRAIGSFTILTERPFEDIMRWNRLKVAEPAMYPDFVFFYRIQDSRCYHTIDRVTIEAYGYDQETTYTQINANGRPIFPDACIPAYITGALATLLKEEEYPGQAQFYQSQFGAMLEEIKGGFSPADPMQPSTPVKGNETR